MIVPVFEKNTNNKYIVYRSISKVSRKASKKYGKESFGGKLINAMKWNNDIVTSYVDEENIWKMLIRLKKKLPQATWFLILCLQNSIAKIK